MGGTERFVGSTSLGWFRTCSAETVAGQVEAVGIVDEAIEDGVGVGRVPEHRRMPSSSTGLCPRSRSRIRITPFMGNGSRLSLCVRPVVRPSSLSNWRTAGAARFADR